MEKIQENQVNVNNKNGVDRSTVWLSKKLINYLKRLAFNNEMDVNSDSPKTIQELTELAIMKTYNVDREGNQLDGDGISYE